MGSIAGHKARIQEHLDELTDAIALGIGARPVTIGMHTSACAIELLELYLHKLGKIPVGKVIKHEWFKRPRPEQKVPPLVERKLDADFPHKAEIYELLYTIEEHRTVLVYGRATLSEIENVLNTFHKLKEKIHKELEKHGEKI